LLTLLWQSYTSAIEVRIAKRKDDNERKINFALTRRDLDILSLDASELSALKTPVAILFHPIGEEPESCANHLEGKLRQADWNIVQYTDIEGELPPGIILQHDGETRPAAKLIQQTLALADIKSTLRTWIDEGIIRILIGPTDRLTPAQFERVLNDEGTVKFEASDNIVEEPPEHEGGKPRIRIMTLEEMTGD